MTAGARVTGLALVAALLAVEARPQGILTRDLPTSALTPQQMDDMLAEEEEQARDEEALDQAARGLCKHERRLAAGLCLALARRSIVAFNAHKPTLEPEEAPAWEEALNEAFELCRDEFQGEFADRDESLRRGDPYLGLPAPIWVDIVEKCMGSIGKFARRAYR